MELDNFQVGMMEIITASNTTSGRNMDCQKVGSFLKKMGCQTIASLRRDKMCFQNVILLQRFYCGLSVSQH